MNELVDMFAHAIHHHDCSLDIEGQIMFVLKGEAAFEPFDEKLASAICEFVGATADACRTLSPRVRTARIRARVADFLAQHQVKP